MQGMQASVSPLFGSLEVDGIRVVPNDLDCSESRLLNLIAVDLISTAYLLSLDVAERGVSLGNFLMNLAGLVCVWT